MVTIANPIYNSVLKFLLQDTRIAMLPKHKLEEMLSTFKNEEISRFMHNQTVRIADYFDKSEEYQMLARRLQEAAVDEEVRKRMRDEDDLMREYCLMKENERLRMEAAENRGKEVGIEIGERNGIILVAKNMKSMELPDEDITKATGLSAEEIAKL